MEELLSKTETTLDADIAVISAGDLRWLALFLSPDIVSNPR